MVALMRFRINKNFLRQALSVFLCFALVFAGYQKAKANPAAVAVAAGIEVGVGVYVGAALVVGGLAALVGYEQYGDEIKRHAQNVWADTQDAVREGMRASIQYAVEAGAATLTLGKAVVDYFRTKEADMRNTLVNKITVPRSSTTWDKAYENPVNQEVVLPPKSGTGEVPPPPIVRETRFPATRIQDGSVQVTFTFEQSSPYVFYVPVSDNTYVFRTLTINRLASKNPSKRYEFSDFEPVSYTANPYVELTAVPSDVRVIEIVEDIFTYTVPKLKTGLYVLPRETALQKVRERERIKYAPTVIGTPAFPVSSTGTMTVPFPMGKIMEGARSVPEGKQLTWNEAGYWELDGVPYSGEFTWDFPLPRVVTDTGVIEIPDAIPVPPGPAPGGEGPPWELPRTAVFDFSPLQLAGDKLTERFPFSIPWDIKRQLSVFDVKPKSPVLKVDKDIPVFNQTIKLKFNIDFSIFDQLAAVVRWFLILAFDIALVLGLRRFLHE